MNSRKDIEDVERIRRLSIQYALGDANLAIASSLAFGVSPGIVAIAARGLELGVNLKAAADRSL